MKTDRAFFFDAAACSGCKACQVACKDRGGHEVGRLWRRVSEVAGGGWRQEGEAWRQDVFAYHLSISCNHCARPICAEGCPARAITRRADGVVLLDEDLCLGCGYCSWVCPYSAPQYDETVGTMSKCDFCAEEAAAGLEPACVASCPVRALDAGPWSELARKHGLEGEPASLHPLPEARLTEPSLLLADHAEGRRSLAEEVELVPRPRRGLREWSLVAFTLLSQAAAGAAIFGGLLRGLFGSEVVDPFLMPAILGMMVGAMALSSLHLGRPARAPRALSNLRTSWLSREILLAGGLTIMAALAWLTGGALGAAWWTVPAGVLYVAGMTRVYMQRTVPVWDRWHTPAGFVFSALLLGGIVAVMVTWGRSTPPALVVCFIALLMAGAQQVDARRQFYARYERLGV